ncbi:MAG: S24 family peptidase [SAR324 cluster bacterium]|nr:S24 family peptidase [SAR324 cluster bacterium]
MGKTSGGTRQSVSVCVIVPSELIFDQDLLIVDRSKKKPNGKVVIASLNGDFTLKRLVQTSECFELQPENPEYDSIPISFDDDFQIWGVVHHVIHKL